MAKSQKKSNREIRKPKADKTKVAEQPTEVRGIQMGAGAKKT